MDSATASVHLSTVKPVVMKRIFALFLPLTCPPPRPDWGRLQRVSQLTNLELSWATLVFKIRIIFWNASGLRSFCSEQIFQLYFLSIIVQNKAYVLGVYMRRCGKCQTCTETSWQVSNCVAWCSRFWDAQQLSSYYSLYSASHMTVV